MALRYVIAPKRDKVRITKDCSGLNSPPCTEPARDQRVRLAQPSLSSIVNQRSGRTTLRSHQQYCRNSCSYLRQPCIVAARTTSVKASELACRESKPDGSARVGQASYTVLATAATLSPH